ncbi:hypothetical protein [Thetidibacter halocola]|uniref:Uncharacterized protein n=1 Tax=Thetidibacter halocola TaxID=2827239 RepID=A0A8J7WBU6_9RHOB|nr:hypothetical protein [Thetidibacter halocola]MBS0124690.1 hypothetical protein [Thetidibacter halocola]
MGWLAVYPIVVFLSGAFGPPVPTVPHSGDKAGQPRRPRRSLADVLRPTVRNFVGWLALYLIAVFLSGAFGFSVPTATHSGVKGPSLALMGLVWTFVGWLPLAIILLRGVVSLDKHAKDDKA